MVAYVAHVLCILRHSTALFLYLIKKHKHEMKKLNFILLLACSISVMAQNAKTSDEQKVEALLKQMTLDEKLGQMTQVNISMILKGGYGNQDGSIDPAQLKEAITKYKVGSILNALHAYTVDEWHRIITEIQDETKKIQDLYPYFMDLMPYMGKPIHRRLHCFQLILVWRLHAILI